MKLALVARSMAEEVTFPEAVVRALGGSSCCSVAGRGLTDPNLRSDPYHVFQVTV